MILVKSGYMRSESKCFGPQKFLFVKLEAVFISFIVMQKIIGRVQQLGTLPNIKSNEITY